MNKVDKDSNVPTNDCISRQATIDAINTHFGFNIEGEYGSAVQEVINGLPSAQPEIIACGDCKHWICHDRRCGYWNHGVKPLMWCSQAERKENR